MTPALPLVVSLCTRTPPHEKMKHKLLPVILSLAFLPAAFGQSGPVAAASPAGASQGDQPVSYASMNELNGLLSQLDATSKSTQSDLVKLRIEKWKTDNSYKKQALGNVDAIQRNLQGALPEIVGQLRANPENVPATFKLYRNLDALYDVLGSVVEGVGAFGSKDDLQSLSNDLGNFENTRKQLAQRIENLSTSKESEIVRLRQQLKTAEAEIPATPPKKIVVDDNEPAKKPVHHKATAKKSTPTKTESEKEKEDKAKQQQQQNATKPQ